MKLDAKNVSVSIAGTTIVRNLSIEVPDLKFSALLVPTAAARPLCSALSIAHKKWTAASFVWTTRTSHIFRQKAGAEHGGDGPIQPDQF